MSDTPLLDECNANYRARMTREKTVEDALKAARIFIWDNQDGYFRFGNCDDLINKINAVINDEWEPRAVGCPKCGRGYLASYKTCPHCFCEDATKPDPKCKDARYIVENGVMICENCRRPADEIFGGHPAGGPCIHVWALTNRSAIENGKCEICGQACSTSAA